MRGFLFYLLTFKKVLLIFIYPIFSAQNFLFRKIRQKIENYLIFQPTRFRGKRVDKELLGKFTPQRFVNLEGVRLYGWYIKAQENMPTILHFHGQAESIMGSQETAKFALRNGYGIFMLSYRGHYKSWGTPTEQGLYNDAQTAIHQLNKLGVNNDNIIIWGHSLGSAVAIETASHNDVRAVVLQSPIKNIQSAANDVCTFFFKGIRIPFVKLILKMAIHQIWNINFEQKFDNLGKIDKIHCPVLILHAKYDRITPFKNSKELAAKSNNAELFVSDSGSHWDSNWCFNKVKSFVDNLNVLLLK